MDRFRRRPPLHACLLSACLWLASSNPAFGQGMTDPAQTSALQSVKQQLGGLSELWGSGNADPCQSPPWQGLVCSMGANPWVVTDLNLRNLGLSGTIPAAIFSLTSLSMLDLGYNPGIYGSIPDSFSSLRQLQKLSLQNCSLTGPLPPSMGSLLDLGYLSVRENALTGPLPLGVTGMRRLWWLDITNNMIEGPLPDGIADIDTLVHLHLSGNKLTALPANISRLPNLIHLLIDNNNIVNQPLPPGIMSMKNIEIVQLSNNSFTVTDPAVLTGSSPFLLEFVAHNALKLAQPMPLPDYSGSNFSKIEILDLSNSTLFTGPLPPSISSLKSLITLKLEGNSLNGSLPSTITSMTELETLNLDGNRLSGSVPDLSGLVGLDLHLQDNSITQVALSNLNPTVNASAFQIYLSGNLVCNGSNLHECLPPNCSVTWTAPPLPCGEDITAKCQALTLGSTAGGIFLPNPVKFAQSQTCECASPLRAHVRLPYAAFQSFTSARAATVHDLTVEMLNKQSVPISAPQVVVSEVVRECRPVFVMTLDFYPALDGSLDTLGIRNQLTMKPGFLDTSEFGLQYVQDFVDPAPSTQSSGALSTSEIVGIVVGCVLGAALLASVVALIVYRRTKAAQQADTWTKEDYEELEAIVVTGGVSRFRLQQLRDATGEFSRENRLGEGGYGEVYKGTLEIAGEPGPVVVAVKRAKPSVQSGGKEFRNEIQLLSRCRHRNLVELKGYCREEGEQLLVYEFVGQGTLSEWLHPTEGRPYLTWEQRVQMALGAAKGLAYLHNDIQPPIIHRDIKPGNILVDDDMNAKVADFGLSKTAPEEEISKGLETAIKGTAGFLDPEYYLTDLLTEKSDIYSFGIVLLEMATGQNVFVGNTHIRNRVCRTVNEQGIMSVMDETLGGPDRQPPSPNAFEVFLRTAMQCCTKKATARPSMREVEAVLSELAGAGGGQQGGHSGQRLSSSWASKAGGSSADTVFQVDDDEDDVNILPPGAFGVSSSTGQRTSRATFSEDSGAFVGPDGELYENSGGGLHSEVVAK